MAFKISYFFEQQVAKTGGWSESFFHSADDLATAVAASNLMAGVLMALHGRTTVLRNIRFSEVGSFRRSVIAPQTYTNNPQVPADWLSDYPTNALLLRLRAPGATAGSPGYTVNQWIKGVPDFVIGGGGFYTPTEDYPTRVTTLISQLLNQGWRLKVQSKDVPKKKVNSISETGLVTVASHGYANGDYVRISRAKGDKRVNKVWRISTATPDTFQLLFWQSVTPPTPIFGDPVAQKQVAIFVAPTGGSIIRCTERKVGRPFALLSGRRRSRAS